MNYQEQGKDILNLLGTELFHPYFHLGSYELLDWDKHPNCNRIKLKTKAQGYSSKKGSFVYVYILNDKEVIYIGQTVITSRIFTPSSIGGFNKTTGDVIIPSKKHGKRNVSTFFQVYDLLKTGNKVDVFVIEAKANKKVVTEFGNEFSVILKPQEMEKFLQDKYKEVHGRLPLMHDLHESAYNF